MKFYDRGPIDWEAEIEETPEGFILCKNVPIARVGTYHYLGEEIPGLEPGRDGVILVERREADVFDPASMASFNGKPVVGDEEDDHPDDMVCPQTYRQVSVGTTINPRRGEGLKNDLLIADLLIMDASAIAAVRAGKRQVSCGYDAEYEQIEPGRARQYQIVGNHVAIVKRGRCGTRCSIGDEEPMALKKKGWFDRFMGALDAGNEEELKKLAEEKKEGTNDEGNDGIHLHLHAPGAEEETTDEPVDEPNDEPPSYFTDYMKASDARFGKIEDSMGQLMKKLGAGEEEETTDEDAEEEEGEDEAEGDVADEDADEEEEKKTPMKDSGALVATFKTVLSDAEILSPGIKFPSFDAKASKKSTMDSMCLLRRRALAAHASTAAGAENIKMLTGKDKLTLNKMTCDSVSQLFTSAVGVARHQNNSMTIDLKKPVLPGSRPRPDIPVIKTGAELNKFNREFYAKKTTH